MNVVSVLTKEDDFTYRDVKSVAIGIDGLRIIREDDGVDTFKLKDVLHFVLHEIN